MADVERIKPGINIPGVGVVYPTGRQWLVYFAAAGYQWAIDALAELPHHQAAHEGEGL